jgi:hypothetical protein
MQLVRVNSLPKGAVKDGPPLRMEDHGGSTVQDYRLENELYEFVKKDNGEIRIFQLIEEA